MSPPPILSAPSRTELEALLVELSAEAAALKQTASKQRQEIARLEFRNGRPNINGKPDPLDQ